MRMESFVDDARRRAVPRRASRRASPDPVLDVPSRVLGGLPIAVRNIRMAHPRLTLAGFRHGYFGPSDEAEVIAEINRARPDILWVGRGVPVEQEFAIRRRDSLTGVGLIKTSGGLFDFLAGKNR